VTHGPDPFDHLDADTLRGLLEDFARNWLAHDGVWFQAVEHAHGMTAALEADREAWARFAPLEARRILQRFGIPEGGGLDSLAQALARRMYVLLNRCSVHRVDEQTLQLRMLTCRVQEARHRKELPPFPCKEVGLVEFSSFARAVDPRIQTRCLTCPPDRHGEGPWCAWEFTLSDRDVPAS
jgi:hypothetical protein